MNHIMPLNNDWFFKPSFSERDVVDETDLDDFSPVRLPHTNIELPFHYFDETQFQFVSCYKRKLPIIEFGSDEEVVVHFEGVMTAARVYINQTFVFEHRGGYTPFEVDITTFLTKGDNWLTVQVDSTERSDIPPFGFVVDYLTYGGIYREVQIVVRNKQHFDAVKIETPVVSIEKCTANITFKLSKLFRSGQTIIAQLLKEKHVIAEKTIAAHQLNELHSPDDTLRMNIAFDMLDNIQLWSPEQPELYELTLALLEEDHVIDTYQSRFGFRTVAFQDDGFTINGIKLKLRGLNRHQSFPYVGYAMPKSAQAKDADILKFDLGVNIARSSHYPPSRHFLDRCDEIGLLVFEEIPGWQHIGDTDWQAISLQNVEEMITRDWNRPSVILWGVRINESADSDAFYEKTNALAHKLDSTRQTGGVRNFDGSHVFEDVYTYNDFIHRGHNVPLESAMKIAKKKMPYLVTEHNGHMYPTKSFDIEAKRIEHALRHARVLNSAYASPDISGAIGWCMADYNTHKDFGSGDKICYHGVLDMFRIPKYAASVYASQADHAPVMTVASSMLGGDFEASELGKITVFTNCDTVKVYKNDRFIKSFKPTNPSFSALPHPPIFVDDLIGDFIKENERFSEKDADAIKAILLKFVEYGNALPLKYKIHMGYLFLKYKMNFADGAALYGKYVASWGEKSTVYKFEGYKDGACVCVSYKDSSYHPKLSVAADQEILMETETYDVTRVVIQLTDAYDQPLYYSNAVAELKTTSDVIEVIGPKQFALIGGTRAFWVKTTGKTGTASIDIQLDNGLTKTVTLTVK